jgi:hypothetical protein
MSYLNLLYLFVNFNFLVPHYFLLPFLIFFIFQNKMLFNKKILPLYGIVSISSLYNMFYNSDTFNPLLYFHLFFIIFISFTFIEKRIKFDQLLISVKFISVLNFVLLFTYFFDLRDMLFYENLSFFRFKSLYMEPSIIALCTVLNMVLLFLYDVSKLKKYFILINAVVLFFTFSGSGFGILLGLLLLYGLKKVSIKNLLFLGIALFVSMLYIEHIDNAFTHRVISLLSGNFDTSAVLRFFAPFELITNIIKSNPINLFFGVGDPRLFIKANFSQFELFYLWNGEPTYQVNNAYAVMFGMGGILLILSMVSNILFTRKKTHYLIYAYVLLFPFFSGHFVSIHFFFLVALIKYTAIYKDNNECSHS